MQTATTRIRELGLQVAVSAALDAMLDEEPRILHCRASEHLKNMQAINVAIKNERES